MSPRERKSTGMLQWEDSIPWPCEILHAVYCSEITFNNLFSQDLLLIYMAGTLFVHLKTLCTTI